MGAMQHGLGMVTWGGDRGRQIAKSELSEGFSGWWKDTLRAVDTQTLAVYFSGLWTQGAVNSDTEKGRQL